MVRTVSLFLALVLCGHTGLYSVNGYAQSTLTEEETKELWRRNYERVEELRKAREDKNRPPWWYRAMESVFGPPADAKSKPKSGERLIVEPKGPAVRKKPPKERELFKSLEEEDEAYRQETNRENKEELERQMKVFGVRVDQVSDDFESTGLFKRSLAFIGLGSAILSLAKLLPKESYAAHLLKSAGAASVAFGVLGGAIILFWPSPVAASTLVPEIDEKFYLGDTHGPAHDDLYRWLDRQNTEWLERNLTDVIETIDVDMYHPQQYVWAAFVVEVLMNRLSEQRKSIFDDDPAYQAKRKWTYRMEARLDYIYERDEYRRDGGTTTRNDYLRIMIEKINEWKEDNIGHIEEIVKSSKGPKGPFSIR